MTEGELKEKPQEEEKVKVRTKKITINFDNGPRVIEMKPVKGRHTKKVWKYLQKLGDGEDINSVTDYLDYLDKTASELTGLTIEELDDLDIDEKEKLTNLIANKAFDSLNFSKPSLKPVDYTQKSELR